MVNKRNTKIPVNSFCSFISHDANVNFENLLNSTKNLVMRKILEKSRIRARNNEPILISGETGVGKNLLAQAIHNESNFKDLYEVNCKGIEQQVFENELFGCKESGGREKSSLLKKADGGTIFFDEISEISLSSQQKLLNVIDEGVFSPIGSNESIHTDIRFVFATDKNLEFIRNSKKFCSHLFYRLQFYIRIPSLRERPEDISTLISYFFDMYSKEINKPNLLMDSDVLYMLMKYSFPGNIKELKFAIQRAVYSAILDEEVMLDHLPEWMYIDEFAGLNLKSIEKKHILHVLDLARGNKTKAAEILGVTRSALSYKLEEIKQDSSKNTEETNEN